SSRSATRAAPGATPASSAWGTAPATPRRWLSSSWWIGRRSPRRGRRSKAGLGPPRPASSLQPAVLEEERAALLGVQLYVGRLEVERSELSVGPHQLLGGDGHECPGLDVTDRRAEGVVHHDHHLLPRPVALVGEHVRRVLGLLAHDQPCAERGVRANERR